MVQILCEYGRTEEVTVDVEKEEALAQVSSPYKSLTLPLHTVDVEKTESLAHVLRVYNSFPPSASLYLSLSHRHNMTLCKHRVARERERRE